MNGQVREHLQIIPRDVIWGKIIMGYNKFQVWLLQMAWVTKGFWIIWSVICLKNYPYRTIWVFAFIIFFLFNVATSFSTCTTCSEYNSFNVLVCTIRALLSQFGPGLSSSSPSGLFNALWPSDTIRRHGNWSTFVQVMACWQTCAI